MSSSRLIDSVTDSAGTLGTVALTATRLSCAVTTLAFGSSTRDSSSSTCESTTFSTDGITVLESVDTSSVTPSGSSDFCSFGSSNPPSESSDGVSISTTLESAVSILFIGSG